MFNGLTFILTMVVGYIFSKFKKINKLYISLIQDLLLYLTLFFMGVNLARIEGIFDKIAEIGLISLAFALIPLLGILLVSYIIIFFFKKEEKTEYVPNYIKRSFLQRLWLTLREPIVLILFFFAIGFTLSSFIPFDSSIVITVILHLIMFFVGISLQSSNISMFSILKDPLAITSFLVTIVGTYLGSFVLYFMFDFSLAHILAATSGFAWYSLSGVLITSLGHPILGSISFLSNLFREILSFMLIPILAKISQKSLYMGVSVSGCASMDCLLPLLRRSYSDKILPIAIFHGIVFTPLIPILIPFWLSF